MLRIIAGTYRSRTLLAPPDEAVSRPYGQRVRESVFDRLREWFEGARVLDLFAGVGTVGLEAVSRGAASVVMVERDRRIFRILQRNIEALGCGDRTVAVHGDALAGAALLRAPAPVDLVFVDPPYDLMREADGRERVITQVGRCREVMAEASFLVLRSPLGPEAVDLVVPTLAGPEPYRYGPDLWVLLYSPRDEARSDAGRETGSTG